MLELLFTLFPPAIYLLRWQQNCPTLTVLRLVLLIVISFKSFLITSVFSLPIHFQFALFTTVRQYIHTSLIYFSVFSITTRSSLNVIQCFISSLSSTGYLKCGFHDLILVLKRISYNFRIRIEVRIKLHRKFIQTWRRCLFSLFRHCHCLFCVKVPPALDSWQCDILIYCVGAQNRSG